jgi:hypothetical protein
MLLPFMTHTDGPDERLSHKDIAQQGFHPHEAVRASID